jgi:hypothetical protein
MTIIPYSVKKKIILQWTLLMIFQFVFYYFKLQLFGHVS